MLKCFGKEEAIHQWNRLPRGVNPRSWRVLDKGWTVISQACFSWGFLISRTFNYAVPSNFSAVWLYLVLIREQRWHSVSTWTTCWPYRTSGTTIAATGTVSFSGWSKLPRPWRAPQLAIWSHGTQNVFKLLYWSRLGTYCMPNILWRGEKYHLKSFHWC